MEARYDGYLLPVLSENNNEPVTHERVTLSCVTGKSTEVEH